MNAVATGLLGSESAAVATTLADAWEQRLGTWTADIRGFGESVSTAANRYAASDEAAEEAFDGSWWERLTSWL